jgi:hypothetical protein
VTLVDTTSLFENLRVLLLILQYFPATFSSKLLLFFINQQLLATCVLSGYIRAPLL